MISEVKPSSHLGKLEEAFVTPVSVAREMTEAVLAAAERVAQEGSEDPVRAIIKAYNEMDKEMMRVVDEHIERVRKSNERNKEEFRKLAIKKEIEKRERDRDENFDNAAQKAEELKEFLEEAELFPRK